jgi:hypothetical protein
MAVSVSGHPARSSEKVAQTGSLPYRGLAIRGHRQFQTLADCQSATQQVANLRYAVQRSGLTKTCLARVESSWLFSFSPL